MKNIIYLIALLLAFGCASSSKDSKKIYESSESSEVPEWVYNSGSSCEETVLLCASASAENQNLADTRAKKALAGVFETQIKSSFDVYKTSFSKEEMESVEEEIDSEINESISGILKTVLIKERFKKDDIFFSLASLDKKKSSKGLRAQVKKIDEELKYLYSQKMKGSIKRMMILFEKRTRFMDKLIVLEGSKIPSPVSFSQIQNIKFQSKSGNKVYIKHNNELPAVLLKHLEEILGESGFEISDNLAVDYFISLKYKSIDEYINVAGFKKFTFVLELTSQNNLKKQIGALQISKTSTGRNKQDAFLKVKNDLVSQIDEKLNLLNLK